MKSQLLKNLIRSYILMSNVSVYFANLTPKCIFSKREGKDNLYMLHKYMEIS